MSKKTMLDYSEQRKNRLHDSVSEYLDDNPGDSQTQLIEDIVACLTDELNYYNERADKIKELISLIQP
jgi:predicted house-cleaning noncanonical NTP pyrophosphatase (MazG superfamily)